MNPHVTPLLGTVVARITIPARKVTAATLRTRDIGLLSVRMTTASSVATAAHSVRTDTMPPRKDTEGESRPRRKTIYKPKAAEGICHVIKRINVRVVARPIRSDVPSRPRLTSNSSHNSFTHITERTPICHLTTLPPT